MHNQTIFSGVQPSGILTIGNYLGAIKNWVSLQNNYDCFFCIVDMHAITMKHDPVLLRKYSLETAMWYLACGVDPIKNTIFIQSQVSEHAELAWVLSCYSYMGEMSRMTQFKDKSTKQGKNISVGLFSYPALMAADILLYQADLVPVGSDQKQHLELTRSLAKRFNQLYPNTFTIPQIFIQKESARIMSLRDPSKKMSKSDINEKAVIFLNDDEKNIYQKIKTSVTDSENIVSYQEGKDGINNLMDIYACVTNKNYDQIEKEFKQSGYGHFKQQVAQAVIECLQPIQKKFLDFQKNMDYMDEILKVNREKAKSHARTTLQDVYDKIGFFRF